MPFQKKCEYCSVHFTCERRKSRFHSIACSNAHRAIKKAEQNQIIMSNLTIKQQRFVSSYMHGSSMTNAAFAAGYNVGNPSERLARQKENAIAGRVLASPKVIMTMTTVLDNHGLTTKYLCKLLYEGTNATKLLAINKHKRVRGGEKVFILVPDWGTRIKFIRMAFRLRGLHL